MLPGVGEGGLSSVQEDGLGCLAVNLRLVWLGQELAHRPPEEASLGVPLLEIESSGTCSMLSPGCWPGVFAGGTWGKVDTQSRLCNQKQIPGKNIIEPACWRKSEKAHELFG